MMGDSAEEILRQRFARGEIDAEEYERSLAAEEKGEPMNLTRLAYDQRPRAYQRDLRQSNVFDSRGRLIGRVQNVYVDADRHFRFLGVAMRRGSLVFLPKQHLVPVEVIAGEDRVAITLTVEQQAVESAPTLDDHDPNAAPGEALQRAAREHCGLAADLP
jgi:sporulation protein YlmC with PRC-barrel domain